MSVWVASFASYYVCRQCQTNSLSLNSNEELLLSSIALNLYVSQDNPKYIAQSHFRVPSMKLPRAIHQFNKMSNQCTE